MKIVSTLGYSIQQNFHSKIDGAIKVFHDKQKLKQYMTTSHYYKRFFKKFCTEKIKTNKTMKRQTVPNQRREKARK
jgi:hypothetical protein